MLQIPAVQTWAVSKVAKNLSGKLNTKVTIKRVNFRFFNKLQLEGLMIEDRAKDTLLYAGKAQASVTDWFIFKDKIVLKNISFENTLVNMNRTDSVWNYQFIIDYFVNPNKKNNKKDDMILDVQKVHLNNIIFRKKDKWIGQDLFASLKKLDVIVDEFNISKKYISIREVYIEEPVFSQNDYEGNKPVVKDLTSVMAKIPVVSAFKWNNSGWVFKLKNLKVFNGQFLNEKYTERAPYTDRFDGQHLAFSEINGSLKNIFFINDTLSGNISIRGKEKSGLDIKKLESNLKFTPDLMEFKNLNLQTNNSKLGDYYAMSYNSFNKDMSSFIHNVTLEAKFKESVITSDDLAIFAPQLKNWKRTFFIDGNAVGTIDNFTIKKMKVKTGNSLVEGDLTMRGLPDINTTYIDFTATNLNTTYNELTTVIPNIKNVTGVKLSEIGNVNFKGNFTGFTRDFVAYGKINTSLGLLDLDLNMKIPTVGFSSYSGIINTQSFNVGRFLNNKNLGIVSLQGKIDGKGFTAKEINTNFKGTAKRFDFNNYNFQNIAIDGNFAKHIFKGNFSIKDPNLKIDTLIGSINLAKKDIAVNFDAAVQKADLKALNLINENLSLAGNFSLNFTGSNIDNFLGTARVYNASLKKDSLNLSFDSLTLISQYIDNKKLLTLQTNELDASMEGQFSILQLPNAFKYFLSSYYPAYIKKPDAEVGNQDFSFYIKTNKVNDYIKLIDPRMDGFNDAIIQGNLQLDNSILNVSAQVPSFSYDGKQFNNINLLGNGNRDTLHANIDVGNIKISDSLSFPETKLLLAAGNDNTNIKLITRAGKILNDAELNARVQTLSDGVKIHFFPSSFVINNKKWLLEKDGELTVRKRFIDADEVRFKSGQQEIVISTLFDDLTDDTHLVAKLKNVVIEDFTPFFISDPTLAGNLTGTATLRNPFESPIIDFKGVADSFELNERYLGKVNLAGKYTTSTGQVAFTAKAQEKNYDFDLTGNYNSKDSTGNKLNLDFLANSFNLSILEPYLGTIFSKMEGTANGNLNVSNDGKNTYLTGKTNIRNGKVKIAYTQCSYSFDNQDIVFEKDLIDIGRIQLKDSLNNTGSISGKMNHHFFKDLSFNNVRFETPKLIVLNTTQKDNEQFYGYVIGSALMTINGPVTNLKMNISGQPSAIDSSHIFLPTGESQESNLIDYIDFIQFGSEMTADLRPDQSANILVNLDVVANPALKIDVILDEETGDIIKGQGNGKLNIKVGTKEPLTMRGRYDITKGEYTFNFQTFLKKPFTLNSGSITWNGDPFEAIIDMDAEYLAKNVDISSLTINNNFRQKEDIYILSHLTGSLSKPVITFEFKLPERSEFNRDYVVVNRLANFKYDENAMNKQVASLLLFNSFILENQNFLSQENTFALATNTIGGILSSLLTNVFNSELERATNGVISTYIDINPTVNLQATATQLQANVRAGLKILFSNRLNVLIGGNLDYNNPYSNYLDRKGLFTPDITIEWLLNKDGSLRVVGFNRTSIDITSGQRNRSGVQLSYRKDFNNFTDIFKSRKRIRAIEEEKQRKARETPIKIDTLGN